MNAQQVIPKIEVSIVSKRNLLTEVSDFVRRAMALQIKNGFYYHSITHVEEVVYSIFEIGAAEKLDDDELEVTLLAGWFHDIAYIYGQKDHEARSADIAAEFLLEYNYPLERIELVKSAILSTKLSQGPKSKIERILCDADLLYLGNENFIQKSEMLRKEWNVKIGKKYSDVEWLENNLEFISQIRFHTDYARQKYDGQRIMNCLITKRQIQALLAKTKS